MKSVDEGTKAKVAFWVRHCMAIAARELDRKALDHSANAIELRKRVSESTPGPRAQG